MIGVKVKKTQLNTFVPFWILDVMLGNFFIVVGYQLQ